MHVLTTSSPKSKASGGGGGAGEGKTEEKVVYAASLTARHSFTDHSKLQNTYTLQ